MFIRKKLREAVGDVSGFNIANNEVLIAIYLRPEKTYGGIVLTSKTLDEDIFQSKVGLVLKIGASCKFQNIEVNVGDWVVARPNDTCALELNFVPCRLVYDDQVRATVDKPDMVY